MNINDLFQKFMKYLHLVKSKLKKLNYFACYDIELSRVETKLNSYINTTGKEISNTYWSNLSC